MRISPFIRGCLLGWGIACGVAAPAGAAPGSGPVLHHQLEVDLDPDHRTVRIHDVITLPPGTPSASEFHFHLHPAYRIERARVIDRPEWQLEVLKGLATKPDQAPARFVIRKPETPAGPQPVQLEFTYAGPFHDPQQSQNPAADPGIILLSGASRFYPQPADETADPRLTFRMDVSMPSGWTTLSQGRKVSEEDTRVVWESTVPQEEIFLIADRFTVSRKQHGDVTLYTYLRNEAPGLAQRYLGTAGSYIDFYSRLIAPYPYSKFALVENARQTGWGMPSFTLLGSKIIRFPFILHTSFPHEILHNWWGNGVYIDPQSGNWSEGLTAYLSDHLLREFQEKGDRYRFQQLVKYLNYVNESNDFPLTEFRARDSMASQAIGYGKMLMVIHMLRKEIGDARFLEALRRFYRDHRFRRAGFRELRSAFESVSGRDLAAFFKQWTERTGAPEIELAEATAVPQGDAHQLHLTIRQSQPGPAFELRLPVAVWPRGKKTPQLETLHLRTKNETFTLSLKEDPGAVLVDPYQDVFRRLDRREVPPSISQTYGSPHPARILPAEEELPDVLMGYHQFAQSLVQDKRLINPTLEDSKFSPIPSGSLWVFGKDNQYARHIRPQLERYGMKLDDWGVTFKGQRFDWKHHSFVFTLRRPGNREGSVTWIIVHSGEAVPGLIRKLPHYGKYGYLVFKGSEPENVLKGVWPWEAVELNKIFHPGDYPLPPAPPLVEDRPGAFPKTD